MPVAPRFSSTFRTIPTRASRAAAACVKQGRAPFHLAIVIVASAAEMALTLIASVGIVAGLYALLMVFAP